MSETLEPQTRVLIGDDERKLSDWDATWLDDAYEVRTTHNDKHVMERTDEDVDVALLDIRLDEYVTKPIERDELEGKIQTTLQRLKTIDEFQRVLSLLVTKTTVETELIQDEFNVCEKYQKLHQKLSDAPQTADRSLTICWNKTTSTALFEGYGTEELI